MKKLLTILILVLTLASCSKTEIGAPRRCAFFGIYSSINGKPANDLNTIYDCKVGDKLTVYHKGPSQIWTWKQGGDSLHGDHYYIFYDGETHYVTVEK